MLTNTKIHEIYQEMQQGNGIKKTPFPEYTIYLYNNIKHNNFIEIYGHLEHTFKAQTNQLSDIHAILQLCHPNEPYYIHYGIQLSEDCPRIPVYSYSDAPNIITGRNPTNKYNTYCIMDLSSINITIQPGEALNNTLQSIANSRSNILTCIQQHPDITFGHTQLQLYTSLPSNDHMLIHITAIRMPSNEAEIKISLCHKSTWLHVDILHIPMEHTNNIYTQYHAHITHNLPPLFQDINAKLSESQHEKIHISRAINQYLTTRDDGIFRQIQDCINILRDHFIYIPKDPHLSTPQ